MRRQYTVQTIIVRTVTVQASDPDEARRFAANTRTDQQQHAIVGVTITDDKGVMPTEIPLGDCPVSTGEGMDLDRCRDFCGHPCTWLQETETGGWCTNPSARQYHRIR